MRRYPLVILFMALMSMSAAAVPGISFSQEAPAGRMFTLDTLLRLDDYRIHERSFTVSPDSRSVAVVAMGEDGSNFVVLNGEAGTHYSIVDPGSLSFSPDGKRLSYVAGAQARLFVVVDGTPLRSYPRIIAGPPVFSPDGSKLAFVADSAAGEFVVEYELEGKAARPVLPFQYISGRGPGWLHYVADSASRGISGPEFTEGRPYDSIARGSLAYSPDGAVLAYTATRDSGKLLVYGGEEGGLYDEVPGPVFGPAGKNIAYAAKKDKKWRVVMDGSEGKAYNLIMQNSLVLDAAGAPVYVAISKGKHLVVRGGSEGNPRKEIKSLALSRDGRLAYFAKAGKGWLACVDGKDGKTYDKVGGTMHFSPDGKHVAYAAARGEDWFLVRDGEEAGPFMGVADDRIAFSPDGARIAFAAQTGRREWVPVVDGEKLMPVHSIPGELLFGPDGRHFANIGVRGVNQFVAVDGTFTGLYDGIVIWSGGSVVFDDSDSLHYLAVKKRTVFLVEEFYD